MTARRTALVFLIAGGIAYGLSGWVVVAPGETVVVRRFGHVVTPPWGPGLHLGAPVGFDRIDRVRTDEVRRLPIGLASTPKAGDEPSAGEFLTGDLNLLRAEATLQYRVSDPIAFVTGAQEPEAALRRLALASVSWALARQGVDAALGEGRGAVALDAARAITEGAERYQLGVSVLGVNLTDARPPSEVAPEFAAAQSARSEAERRVNEARTYAAATLSEANATAGARLERARGAAERTVTLAKGRASAFLAVLAEADKSRGATVRRMYLDSLRNLWPRVGRTLVLTPEEPLDLSLFGNR